MLPFTVVHDALDCSFPCTGTLFTAGEFFSFLFLSDFVEEKFVGLGSPPFLFPFSNFF